MTTIAYKDGIIAWDSQETAGDMVVSRNIQKMVRNGHLFFWGCGVAAHIEQLAALIAAGHKTSPDDLQAGGMLWDGKDLYVCGMDDDNIVLSRICLDDCYAIGSGSEYAIGAMDFGATAQESVKIAANRDVNTGGRIRTKRIGA